VHGGLDFVEVLDDGFEAVCPGRGDVLANVLVLVRDEGEEIPSIVSSSIGAMVDGVGEYWLGKWGHREREEMMLGGLNFT